jgi:heme-degrading monooxygenase HmoA
MSYATFEELLIHTEWRSYPDQTARLERKAEAKTQAQQKKKRTTSKKKKAV